MPDAPQARDPRTPARGVRVRGPQPSHGPQPGTRGPRPSHGPQPGAWGSGGLGPPDKYRGPWQRRPKATKPPRPPRQRAGPEPQPSHRPQPGAWGSGGLGPPDKYRGPWQRRPKATKQPRPPRQRAGPEPQPSHRPQPGTRGPRPSHGPQPGAWGSGGLGPPGKYRGPWRRWPKATEQRRPPRPRRRSSLVRRAPAVDSVAGMSQEHQAELAHLHFVAAVETGHLDALPVHIGAVQAAHVAHGERTALPVELRVPAGHGDIVEEDIALRVTPGRGEVAVEQESAARVRPAFHDEQRCARRKCRRRCRVGSRLVRHLRLGGLPAPEGDRGSGFAWPLAAGAAGERVAAV